MRIFTLLLTMVMLGACIEAMAERQSRLAAWLQERAASQPTALGPNSLCTKDEQIIFSCTLKRTAKRPARIASLCGSRDLAKDRGYLQYRFGLPRKVELEFPKDRSHTQEQFRYSHYFRFQVDLTEITFKTDDYEYEIFDTYNGEEKPPITEQGVTVTPLPPAKPIDVTLTCAGKPKADYSKLADVLANDPQ